MAGFEFLPILNNKPWIGRHANENDALTFLRNQHWDTNADGTGQPREGMEYYDSGLKKKKYWNGSLWVLIEAGAIIVPVHDALFGLNVGDYQHLTAANKITLTGGFNADALHTHAGLSGDLQTGSQIIGLGTDSALIILPVPYLIANYRAIAQIENLVDPAPPLFLHFVRAKTLTDFTIEFSAAVPTANYVLNWLTQV